MSSSNAITEGGCSNFARQVIGFGKITGHLVVKMDASNEVYGGNAKEQLNGRTKQIFASLACAVLLIASSVLLFHTGIAHASSTFTMYEACGGGVILGSGALVMLKEVALQSVAYARDKKKFNLSE